MAGVRARLSREAQSMRAQAWYTAALSKSRRLPDFKTFVSGEARKPQTRDEMFNIFKGMAAYYAGALGKKG